MKKSLIVKNEQISISFTSVKADRGRSMRSLFFEWPGLQRL